MEHAFNTNIAAKYDVNIAVLLHNFKFWTLNNLANKRNVHEGLCWTYDTVQAFCEIFHYWTRHQIEHLLKKAEGHGLIVSGNLNQHKYDRTKWYALTPAAYKFYDELQTDPFLERLYSSISPEGEMHKSLSLLISEKSEMVFEDFRNLFLKIPRPIPDTIPDKIKDINTGVSDETLDDKNFENKSGDEHENSNLVANEVRQDENMIGFEAGNNQTLGALEAKKGLDGSNTYTKSGYFDNQINKCIVPSKITQYDLNNILSNNIYQIPEQVIQDWITNRKKKRAAVTKTAWNKINKELAKCQEQGIDPIEAFETFVANGWQSFKIEWFLKDQSTSQGDSKNSSQSNLKNYW